MWTYLLGPFLSIFPKRWREALPFSRYVRWARATAISGLAESAAALTALSYWYTEAMTTWVGRGVDVALNGALSGKSGPEMRPQDIGAVALIVWASHPLTWLLAYAGIEGALRVGAALTGVGLGTLPFFLVDQVFVLLFGRRQSELMEEAGSSANNLSSVGGAIRERIASARLSSSSDELSFKRSGGEEILEIYASRRKEGWDPPRTVRYADTYYRLEAASMTRGPRPFHYTLRRLPAGVPGRTVLLYSPVDVVIREGR
jgi:hypothetical protein